MTLTSEQLKVLRKYLEEAESNDMPATVVSIPSLRAAVDTLDRLPETADGAKIVPGGTVYFDSSNDYVQSEGQDPIQPVEFGLLACSPMYGVVAVDPSECHSTPEAAKQATAQETD